MGGVVSTVDTERWYLNILRRCRNSEIEANP